MEIERKWLMSGRPSLPNIQDIIKVSQSYIPISSGEIRVRSLVSELSEPSDAKYCVTIKSDGTMSRYEWEKEVPVWVYDLLIRSSQDKIITKCITKVLLDTGLYLEFHDYDFPFDDLLILECEFPDQATAESFGIPNWLSHYIMKEVTDDVRYKNKNLALNGMPKN